VNASTTLDAGAAVTLGNAVTLGSGVALTVPGSNALTLSGVVGGNGSLIKNGAPR
jgi:hypothetical protein